MCADRAITTGVLFLYGDRMQLMFLVVKRRFFIEHSEDKKKPEENRPERKRHIETNRVLDIYKAGHEYQSRDQTHNRNCQQHFSDFCHNQSLFFSKMTPCCGCGLPFFAK